MLQSEASRAEALTSSGLKSARNSQGWYPGQLLPSETSIPRDSASLYFALKALNLSSLPGYHAARLGMLASLALQ